MRKPGISPLIKPAPVAEAPPAPQMIENEYGTLVAEDEPILWVRLNEEEGDDVFEMHNVGVATVIGAPTRSGVLGQGMTFDGDDGIFIGCGQIGNYPPRLMNEAGVFTIELLMDSQYSSEGASRLARWGSYGIELVAYKFAGADNSGYLTLNFYDEAAATHTVEIYSSDIYTPGVQSHISATYDGEDIKLYVNGVLMATQNDPGVIPYFGFTTDDSNGLGIGVNGPFNDGFFEGSIAEFALYDTVLSEARLLEHAEADHTPTLTESATVSPWPTPGGLGGASSFYLTWTNNGGELPSDPTLRDLYTRAECKLTLPGTPDVEELYFWALQVFFYDAAGEQLAGAHGGLQWAPGYPQNKAVCWGGYSDVTSEELTGTVSDLPSALDNLNVRDYEWETGTEYTINLFSVGDDYWRMTINGTVVRDLLVPDATHIGGPIIFSEVFADCYAPSVSSRWRDLAMYDASDTLYEFPMVSTSFQEIDACDNTDSTVDGEYFVMTTNTDRLNGPTVLDSRGDFLYFDYANNDGGFPLPGDMLADSISWDIRVDELPTPEFSNLRISAELFFRSDTTDWSGFMSIALFWDPTKAVFKTLRLNGGYFDEVEGVFHPVAIVTSLDLVDFDGEYYYYDFPWGVDEYNFAVTNIGPELWSLTIDGVEVATLSLVNWDHVAFYMSGSRHGARCGENQLVWGVGNITAANDDPATATLDTFFAQLYDYPCANTDQFVLENEWFMVDSVTTRTLDPDGEFLSIT